MYQIMHRYLPSLQYDSYYSEIDDIHPAVEKYLENNKFEVYHETQAFRVSYISHLIERRMDFLAFRSHDILIVECKGSSLTSAKVFGAVLQLTLYMRLYRMLQRTPDPQLHFDWFDEKYDASLIRQGTLRGALAVPAKTLTPHRIDILRRTSESMQLMNLSEPTLEILALQPNLDSEGNSK